MLKLKKVSVTGELSSGKTEVCLLFRKLGSFVVNADAIVHELLSLTSHIGLQVVELFGSDVVQNGLINRRAIAKKVFDDFSLLQQLESVIHPEVCQQINIKYQEAEAAQSWKLFVAEVPLLFESGGEGFYDTVIFVHTDENKRKRRFIDKTGSSSDEFHKRCRRFWPAIKRMEMADFIINNNGSTEELFDKVLELFNILKVNI